MTDRDIPVTDATRSLAEDLLLVLFQPDSGTIAGENTLFYVLAGGVLVDLSLDDAVSVSSSKLAGDVVSAVADREPADELQREMWTYVAAKPRGVQTVLAALGPKLREPLLERLVERGDIVRKQRKALGLFTTTVLAEGDSTHRRALVSELQRVLVEGVEPSPRAGALAALVWASGALPQFHPEIPWTSEVIERATELEHSSWGASAAAEAVTRTMIAVVTNAAVAAAAAANTGR